MRIHGPVFALILLAGLAACGKKSSEPAVPPPAETPPAAQTPPPKVLSVPVDYSQSAVNEPMPPIDEDRLPPQILLRGPLQATADGIRVEGWVTVYRMQDNSLLLRLDDFRIEGAPAALDVLLTQAGEVPDAAALAAGHRVGALKGANGRMGYPLNIEGAERYNSFALVVPGEARAVASAALKAQ